jgi:hypothetical protein
MSLRGKGPILKFPPWIPLEMATTTLPEAGNVFIDFFSDVLELPRAVSEEQSRAVIDALELLAEVREAAGSERPDLVNVLDEVNSAYIARDTSLATKKLREVKRALMSPSHEFPTHSLAQQREALARIRAGSKPFADYQSFDAPAIHVILDQETVSAKEMAELMKIERQAVDQRRARGELLALQGSKRGYRYPRWQGEPRLWRTLPPVLVLLQDENPWDVFAFLQGRYPALGGRTPIDLLREGKKETVMDFARDAFALES